MRDDLGNMMDRARVGEMLREALRDELESMGEELPDAALTALARGLRERIEAAGYRFVHDGQCR